MKLGLKYFHNVINPNFSIEPDWSSKIKRWSQLDNESFVVAEATQRSLSLLGNPDQLIILSSQGSAHTDYLFAHSKKISPTYFVHTLPNVRSLAFSSITSWEGPVFCFSQGKYSLVRFLYEISTAHHKTNSLIINLNKVDLLYYCDFYKIGQVQTDTHILEKSDKESSDEFLMDDFLFRKKLELESCVNVRHDLIIRKHEISYTFPDDRP